MTDSPPPTHPLGRSILKRLALASTSALFALLLAEVALRVAGIGEPVFRDVDPVLGWAPIPHASGRWTREGGADVVITEHGFRGVGVDENKPNGVLRVAVLGDSYTEAKQVALEATFSALLESELNACLSNRVEVLAFGVSGYGTAQERLLLEHRVWAFDPDVVLLAFLTGNDIADNHPELRASGDAAPYYRLEDGALVLDNSFLESEWYTSRSEGGLMRELRRSTRLLRLLSGILRSPTDRADAQGGNQAELGLRDEIYREPATREWRDAWDWTLAILGAMNDDVHAHGAQLFVVTLTNAIQVHPSPRERALFMAPRQLDDLEYADRRVASAGQRFGFQVLTLTPLLRARAESSGEHLHGFDNTALGTGHWNERGHRAAADEIGAWLCPALQD